MRKLTALLFVLFFLAVPASVAMAQEAKVEGAAATKYILPTPTGERNNPFFGQNQYYTVTFRGNGQAAVAARIVFTNTDEATQSALTFQAPKGTLEDFTALQVIREPSCIEYGTPIPMMMDEKQPTTSSVIAPVRKPAGCLQYQSPDYFGYWGGKTTYQKAPVVRTGNTVTITLPQPVAQNSSGSILVYYLAGGYAKKTFFGAWDGTFETLKGDNVIQQLQIGITTDTDLLLRGLKGKVTYEVADIGSAMKSSDITISAPAANTRFDQYYMQIGQGQIIKTATNLQPQDTYTVTVQYADSWLKLYAKELLTGAGVFVAFLVVMILAVKLIFTKAQPKQTPPAASAKGTPAMPALPSQSNDVLMAFGLSLLSAFLIVAYTIAIMLVNQWIVLGALPYDIRPIVGILIIVISIAFYVMLLVGPAVFLGIRRSLLYGAVTAGLTVLWLVVALIIFFLVYLFGIAPMFMGYSTRSVMPSSPNAVMEASPPVDVRAE